MVTYRVARPRLDCSSVSRRYKGSQSGYQPLLPCHSLGCVLSKGTLGSAAVAKLFVLVLAGHTQVLDSAVVSQVLRSRGQQH